MILFFTIFVAVVGGLFTHQYIVLPLVSFLQDTVEVVRERKRK